MMPTKSFSPIAPANQRGYALLSVTLTLLVLLVLGAASTLFTTLDLRSTAHYGTGNSAFAAAEAGVLHALSTINQTGVTQFNSDIVNRWNVLYGTDTKAIASLPSLTYQVSIAANPADPSNAGTLTVTGFAPLQARRSIVVQLKKGNFSGAPGAIYLAADGGVSSQFSGNAFEVDGNDHDVLGNDVPTGPVKPGISTRNSTVSDAVTNSLGSSQKDNVKGLGFLASPLTPSVLPTGGPSASDLDQLVNHLLSLPNVQNTSTKKFNGNDVFGTPGSPVVTHMTNADVSLNGNASGAGILIVDGSITINGNLDFVGWIVVRGSTVINPVGDTEVSGNATVLGSLWTGDLDIKVGGSAVVDYCDACMRMVDNMNNGNNTLPRPMRVSSWGEVL
jgi:Tfp pilus assembly protein PilX/formylmethanofuran dehydrogenase subunit C